MRIRNQSQLVSRILVALHVVISYFLQAERLVRAWESVRQESTPLATYSSMEDPVNIISSSDESNSGIPLTCAEDLPALRRRFREECQEGGDR